MPQPETKTNDSRAGLYLVLFFVAAFALPALLLGALAYWAGRRSLTRWHWAAVAAVGVAAVAINPTAAVVEYASWLYRSVTGDSSPWPLPVYALAAATAVIAGLIGVAAGTVISAKVSARIPWRKHEPVSDVVAPVSLIPDADVKEKVRSVVPIGESVRPHLDTMTSIGAGRGDDAFIPLGPDANGELAGITARELGMHAVILGGTGSGKSKTIEQLLASLSDLGWDGMLLDLKEDTKPGGLRDFCRTYASRHGIPLQDLGLSDVAPRYWFNPFSGISADEARDTILSLSTFDDQFWQNLNRKVLGQAINLMYCAHKVDPGQFPMPTPRDVGRLLERGSRITDATKVMRAMVELHLPGWGADDFTLMAHPHPKAAESAEGFGMRLTNIYDSEAGRLVLTPGDGKREIDVTAPGITYIGLDSLGKADLTKLMSSSIMQRMSILAAQYTRNPPPGGPRKRYLIIDEANWVDRTILANLLSRARSAGICVIVCTQGATDWEADWGSLANNINVGIIMAQGSNEAAERAADYIGHEEVDTVSRSVRDGEVQLSGTMRSQIQHIVPPHQLRNMGIGEAIVRVGKPQPKAFWVAVQMRNPEH